MKIYLSSDIEGTCGIVDWDETNLNSQYIEYYKNQMSKEVAFACRGANEAGCENILVKDAHDSGRNINPLLLPQNARILRGWTNDPHIMMGGIDSSFDACLFTGYHSGASMDGNPLSHTMSTEYDFIKINGDIASEFTINAYICSYYNIPVAFLSGDKMLCESAKHLNPNIVTVDVSKGVGNGSISIHPEIATELIKDGVFEALSGDLSRHLIKLPTEFDVEIKFKDHYKAYRASFYPGVLKVNSQTIKFTTSDYYDFLRMLLFI